MEHYTMTAANLGNNKRLWYSYLYNQAYGRNVQAVWDIMVPGVMVDNSGTLFYTMEWRFELPEDPQWALGKITPLSNNTLDHMSKRYLYWREHMKLSGVSGGTTSCSTLPRYVQENDDVYPKNTLHNMFASSIAQEVMGSGTASSFFVSLWFPPLRWANTNSSAYRTESYAHIQVRKSDLVLEKGSPVDYTRYGGIGRTPFMLTRTTSWDRYLQPEWGNFKTCYDGNSLYCFCFCHKKEYSSLSSAMYMTLHYSKIIPSSWSETTKMLLMENCLTDSYYLGSRFISFNNAVYHSWCAASSAWVCHHITWLDKSTGVAVDKFTGSYGGMFFAEGQGGRFQRDFCILKNGDQPVFCFMDFKWDASNDDLTSEHGWSSSSANWGNGALFCCIFSVPFSDNSMREPYVGFGTNLSTYAQNVIYNTGVTRYTNLSCASKDGSSLNRLSLNTQMLVPYTSPSGKTYIIYAYCHPGKATQLHLGYAPYYFDSTGHVRLLPKTEFQNFDKFNDCYRIYHMDLKSGHLWIAFVGYNKGYPSFHFFHMLAKDLVRE